MSKSRALQLIEEAKKSNCNFLDLSFLDLAEFPVERCGPRFIVVIDNEFKEITVLKFGRLCLEMVFQNQYPESGVVEPLSPLTSLVLTSNIISEISIIDILKSPKNIRVRNIVLLDVNNKISYSSNEIVFIGNGTLMGTNWCYLFDFISKVRNRLFAFHRLKKGVAECDKTFELNRGISFPVMRATRKCSSISKNKDKVNEKYNKLSKAA